MGPEGPKVENHRFRLFKHHSFERIKFLSCSFEFSQTDSWKRPSNRSLTLLHSERTHQKLPIPDGSLQVWRQPKMWIVSLSSASRSLPLHQRSLGRSHMERRKTSAAIPAMLFDLPAAHFFTRILRLPDERETIRPFVVCFLFTALLHPPSLPAASFVLALYKIGEAGPLLFWGQTMTFTHSQEILAWAPGRPLYWRIWFHPS